MKILTVLIGFIFLTYTAYAQSGSIYGEVKDGLTNDPIPFANIFIEDTDLGAVTDIDGKFKISNITPGIYNVRASYLGYQTQTLFEVQVQSSRPVNLVFELVETSTNLEKVVVKAEPFKNKAESPVSLRSIGLTEIKRSPGGNRDISRVVQSLPGVTSTSTFRNDLIIRGGAPNENRFFLDDVEVPNINHFATQGASGGPAGIINVDFIREVDFYSGAFPANRGNALSSILAFKQKNGRKDRVGATATVGASDIGLSVEGPIGEKVSFIASARRSYLQFLFDVLGLPFLPTYNDFQAKITYKPDAKNEFYFTGIGAIDDFSLNLEANETEEQRFILNNIPINKQWTYTNGFVYKRYEDNGFWTFVLSRNMLNNTSVKYLENDESDPDNLILDYSSQEIENKLRIENTRKIGDWRLNYGVGYQFVKYNNNTFNRFFTSQGPETQNYSTEIDFHKYAAFGQVTKSFFEDKLSASFGFRFDGNSLSDAMNNPIEQFSPRLSLSYAVTNQFKINANAGRYFQLPPYPALGYQEDNTFINLENNIGFIRADHLVLGVEYNTTFSSKISVEGYYKDYSNYPFSVTNQISIANLGNDFGVVGNEELTPIGEGRAYGVEILYQQRLYKGFYGNLAYTLGWSEFENTEGELIPSTWDSRHILSAVVGKRLPKDWEIGVRWRYQTGIPYTPFAENSNLRESWDLNRGPRLDFDQLNTERIGASNIVDVRIDKKWFFKKWSLNLYADLQNVLGNAISTPNVILEYEKDAEGNPTDQPIILNPDEPYEEQRYQVKTLDTGTASLLPIIGLVITI